MSEPLTEEQRALMERVSSWPAIEWDTSPPSPSDDENESESDNDDEADDTPRG